MKPMKYKHCEPSCTQIDNNRFVVLESLKYLNNEDDWILEIYDIRNNN